LPGHLRVRLTAENLRVERGGRTVLNGLGFTLHAGEALAVTGPNGAGKSTLLRALAGLLPLASGKIHVSGGDPERSLAEDMHILGHADGVKNPLTAAENVAFWADFLDGDLGTVATALDAVGLAHAAELPAAFLSAGQKRRLALTRLIVARRDVWLLDEPATALDTDGLSRLDALVEIHRAGGGMVVAATHADLGWPGLKRMVLGSAV
jgi:heme exporter protein A